MQAFSTADLPVVIMEAFALGRPALSTYIAGIPELVDDECGWMILAGSEEALVTATRKALEAASDELARKGKEGRARLEQQHNIETLVRSLLGHFKDTVGPRDERAISVRQFQTSLP